MTPDMTDRIITALDVDTMDQAEKLLNALPEARFFKVGLQAWLGMGSPLIHMIREREKQIFLDLKFKDIPNTVAAAVHAVIDMKPRFLTIHLSGGGAMAKAAAQAAAGTRTVILGVTVLTSLSDKDLKATGCGGSTEETVLRLCELGLENGVTAVVCSPREIKPLRQRFGTDLTLVTPGIRPSWADRGDQKRVLTPAEAMADGADYLVIGRPITRDPDPGQAFRRIRLEITPSRPHGRGSTLPPGGNS